MCRTRSHTEANHLILRKRSGARLFPLTLRLKFHSLRWTAFLVIESAVGYQWLALMENSATHDAQWQPTRDFVDSDGTLTKAFHTYIVQNNPLPHLH